GLGLLESFSEPCEVCAGRGIIVQHDPVTRHRQTAQPEIRRGRGKSVGTNGGTAGRGSAANGAPKNGSGNGTHAITDDVKNALAQIAASTIVSASASVGPVDEAPAQTPGAQTQEARTLDAQAPAGQSAHGQASDGQQPLSESASVAAADAAVAILDIPVKKGTRNSRRISTHDAEQILDSVLEALPEPKQPGQGRSRISRRASSPGTVTPASGDPLSRETAGL
ncbi:MAG: Rne/Rng family ribonuclease, partial [Lacisediminihabitans sp.]